MAESIFRGTTICAVRKNGECAMAGDGQVTMGERMVMKHSARKVRREQQPLVGCVPGRHKPRFHAPKQMAVFRPPGDGVFIVSGHRASPLSSSGRWFRPVKTQ